MEGMVWKHHANQLRARQPTNAVDEEAMVEAEMSIPELPEPTAGSAQDNEDSTPERAAKSESPAQLSTKTILQQNNQEDIQ